MTRMQRGCTLPSVARSIQIRNVPERVHRTLRARAAEAGLSLSDYLLREIVRVADRPPAAEVLARATSRHGGTGTEEVVDAVRSGRDRS